MAHSTIMRWIHHYAPEFDRRWNRFARPAITVEMAKSFSLYLVKAVLNGRTDKVIDLARTNLWRSAERPGAVCPWTPRAYARSRSSSAVHSTSVAYQGCRMIAIAEKMVRSRICCRFR
jgi:hypothetical protein